ncbi:MAG: ABC transporter permease subunit, partial [Planctomycetota bacterium]
SALMVGTIAIALSTSRLVGKRAVFAFYIASVSYVAITAGVDVWLRQRTGGVTWLTMLNPFLAQQSLLSPSAYPRGGPGDAWFLRHPVSAWCLLSTGLSVLLIGLSAFTARLGGLSWLASRGSRGTVPWYRKMFGLGAAGSDYRPPRSVWHNPIAWREAAARNATLGRIVARWGFITAGLAFGVALVVGLHVGQLGAEEFRLALAVTVWAEVAVITLIALNMAATAVTREREDGTLDLLLATPITPTDYLNGKLRGMIAYLLPLLAVPIGTLAAAGIYVLLAGSVLGVPERVEVTRQLIGATVQAPVMLPEGAIVAALVVVPFTAFCVMVGLMWSVKSKGTIGSIVSAAGVVLGVAGVVGLCGWQSASEIEYAGALLAGLSPASALRAVVDPVGAMMGTVGEAGLTPARVFLLIGAAIAAVGQVGVVWAIRVSVVKGFDMTVRRLAGTR